MAFTLDGRLDHGKPVLAEHLTRSFSYDVRPEPSILFIQNHQEIGGTLVARLVESLDGFPQDGLIQSLRILLPNWQVFLDSYIEDKPLILGDPVQKRKGDLPKMPISQDIGRCV